MGDKQIEMQRRSLNDRNINGIRNLSVPLSSYLNSYSIKNFYASFTYSPCLLSELVKPHGGLCPYNHKSNKKKTDGSSRMQDKQRTDTHIHTKHISPSRLKADRMDQYSIKCGFCCAAFPLTGLDLGEKSACDVSDTEELSVNACSFVLLS